MVKNNVSRCGFRVNSKTHTPFTNLLFLKTYTSGQSLSIAGNQLAYDGIQSEWATVVWEAKTGRQLAKLKNNANQVRAVAFTPDARWIVTGDERGSILSHPYESFAPPEDILAMMHRRGLRKFTSQEQQRFATE